MASRPPSDATVSNPSLLGRRYLTLAIQEVASEISWKKIITLYHIHGTEIQGVHKVRVHFALKVHTNFMDTLYNELIGESMNLKMKSIGRVKKKDKKNIIFASSLSGVELQSSP